MTWKVLAAALVAPWVLVAQMKLFVVEQGEERPVGESYLIGAVAAGDALDTTFRVRNSSSATVLLHGLNVAGQRFSFANIPKLPIEMAAGSLVEFTIRFYPLTPGSYSAYLNINGIRHTVLVGTASATYTVSVAGASAQIPLSPGDVVDFGTVDRGSRAVRRFTLDNSTAQLANIQAISVKGTGFHGPAGIQTPVRLEPGQSVSFEVYFEPLAAGIALGTLELDRRSFSLRGTGREPVFPRPQILVEPQTLRGGQQAKVSIRLESTSRASGTGELSMEFTSSVPGKGNDPALLFPATGSRSIAFTVSEGEQTARFGNRTEADFQTGTTAGSIVFTVRLGAFTERATVTIPAAPVTIDSARAIRMATGLDVQATGFDTSRSASRVSFTFFDREGRMVAPGAITVDAGEAFQRYFDSSDFGGMFLLRAVFPVTGNVLQIIAFEVEFANSLGVTRVPRIAIQ